jgi:uroporphyrinogen-III decarboxylase
MMHSPFFVPVVYEHAAQLIGKRPWEVSRDEDLLVAGHTAAYQAYHHTPIVTGIDVYNVEAEAYGSVLGDAGGIAIPSVERNACSEVGEIIDLKAPDLASQGRWPVILGAARRLKERFSDAQVCVPLSGPFSIASNLVGFEELLFGVLEDPALVREALVHLARHQAANIREIHRMGLECIVFESAATPPLLSPASFREVELPALRVIATDHAVATGMDLALVIGGNTVPILPDLLDIHPGMLICPSETDRARFMKLVHTHPGILIRINMSPGVFTVSGSDGAQMEADTALALAAGREKVCIGTGVLPYDADPATVMRIRAYLEEHRR